MLLDVVLPAVEEVLHAQAEEIDVVQDAPFNPGHVLAMDDFTDSSDEEILPPLVLLLLQKCLSQTFRIYRIL